MQQRPVTIVLATAAALVGLGVTSHALSRGWSTPARPITAADSPAPTLPVATDSQVQGQPEAPAVTSSQPGSLVGTPAPALDVEQAEKLIAADMLDRLRSERSAAGISDVVDDPDLTRYATDWARSMATTGYQHSSSERLSGIIAEVAAGSVGENIHAPESQCLLGTPCVVAILPTSGVVHHDWMHSAIHRKLMLGKDWDRVGVGVHCAADGRLWAVLLFASPIGSRTGIMDEIPPGAVQRDTNDGYTCNGVERPHSADWKHPQAS